ncbi:putative RING zinc finger domain superfamily protein [Zea mays]|uniref:RING-type domain-containing protein n=1 Tax=Zea mays TaxID=4577 RepID=C4J6C2_MAIZE|nr:putative RING zinc finger domain superfamily protein [Zea mays]ACR36722.1 unknown [Zea mays]|eukprot:NP_001183423.1 putative RING zinc finger domain superfamily protein [Zea mays]
MGAGSSRADAPSRRRARLGLGGCFGTRSSSSPAAAAEAHDGGSFTLAGSSSSSAIEVQSGRPVRALNFQASLAAKDLQISTASSPRLHSSSSTISHHLRFNHLNCHENKEDGLGTENAETSGLESSSRKAVMVRGSFSNEAVNSDMSGEGISFIGSELENIPSTVSTNETGGSAAESGLGPSLMASERIMSDLEGEVSPQGTSSTTAMTSERSDVSQASLTSMFPNSSIASSVIVEPMPDPISTRADVPIFSGPHGEPGGSILHDDMMSIFSNDGLGRSRDSSSSETRRSHRRILWDTFSRRGSRGYPEFDADDLGFYSTWLDLGDDIFEELGESRYFHRRRHGSIRIREHRRAVFDSGNEQGTAACPLGIHQTGRCTCDSFLVAEESSARASISRIVMLTEALFEVLDEIHRQPASLSLSMVSVQAPESVVNSLPCKSYKKLEAPQRSDDMEQCHICLTEYEDGDQIRILPCKHEFHLQCVDKWLKEIHRVCPLCRGDVCEVAS